VRTTKSDWHVGQDVIVLRRQHRADPERLAGKVTKIAVKYMTVEYPNHRGEPTTDEFSVETGQQRGSYTGQWWKKVTTSEILRRENEVAFARDAIRRDHLTFHGRRADEYDVVIGLARLLDPEFDQKLAAHMEAYDAQQP
jgi:hypothetical protein